MAFKDIFRDGQSSVRKSFFDNFNRVNQSTINPASDGSLWKSVRGLFSISGSKAQGDSSNYPMSTIEMPYSDVKIELSGISQGASAALWVTDSGNWWAVGVDQESSTTCQTCYSCDAYATACANYYYNSSNCNQWNSAYGGFPSLQSYSFCNSSNCASRNAKYNYCNAYNSTNCATNYYYYTFPYVPAGTNCTGNYNASNLTCNTYTYCSSSSAYNCNCVTTYPAYIRIIKSVSNTISEVASWAISSAANSLRVKTSGTQLTIQAYSDASLSNQIGSDIVYSPSGAIIETEFGVSIKPSSYNQGYSIDSVSISKN